MMEIGDWDEPEYEGAKSEPKPPSVGVLGMSSPESNIVKKGIWMNPELAERNETENLDFQDPPILYFLGRVLDVPKVIQVYVEKREGKSSKIWTVLRERDYDLMDYLYEIEEDTLDRFPMSDLNFRVTIFTDGGPSISNTAIKIYDIT